MKGAHSQLLFYVPCSRMLWLMAAWLWLVVPATAQTIYSWNTGDETWDNNAVNWFPSITAPPGAGDDALLGDRVVAADAEVTLGLDTPALNRLVVTGGVDLLMNGFDGEAVTVDIAAQSSRLVVQNGSRFDNNDGATDISIDGRLLVENGGRYDGGEVTLSSGGNVNLQGGVLEIRSNPAVGFLHINSGSELSGWGTVDFGDSGVINNDLLVNEGTIRTSRPFFDVGVRQELVVHTDVNETDPLIDLDGTTESGAVSLAHTTTLTILGTLSDDFSSTIDLGPGSILNVSQPWAMDSGAVIDVDALETQPFIPATFARIEGGDLTADSGSTINVHSGTLQIDADVSVEPGALVEVMENSTLEINGTTLVDDAEAINLAHDQTTLVVNGHLSFFDSSGQFDWDGTGTNAGHAVTEVNGAFFLDVGSFDTGAEPFRYDGTLNVTSGTVGVRVNDDDATPWVMDRELNLANTDGTLALVSGNPLEIGNGAGTLDADVNVSGTAGEARIISQVTFRSDADVEIAADAQLDLEGNVVFDGGEYTGEGVLEVGPTTTVISSTTIGQAGVNTLTLQMDSSDWIINAGQTLSLHVAAIDVADGFGSDMTIENDARLIVNLPDDAPWSYDSGTLTYNGDATVDQFIGGDPVEFQSDAIVQVNGGGRITAKVDVAGTINVTDASGQLELEGGSLIDPNRLSGGTINGPGDLGIFGAIALFGFGDIETDANGSLTAELRADDGTLNVTGSVSGLNIVGTNDADGVLNLANTFNTSSVSDALELRGGEVTGGLIRNDGGFIRGYGRITSSTINNFGTIDADGGTLVIDTVNASQLDGASPNNGQGTLLAVTGDLDVASNVTTVFNGRLEVGENHTFTMSQPGSRFRNAPASQDDDGSGDFGRIEMSGGTIVVANFEQASQLSATGVSTLEAGNINFENGSLTQIDATNSNDRLRLRGNTTIEAGAGFARGGTLSSLVGSSLTLLDGAQLDTVLLRNQGRIQIGNSVGGATVDSYDQTVAGTWTVEIGGTAPGTEHDQLVVTNEAQLDGTLDVELIDLGAGLFVPSLGDTFAILVADSLSGAFQGTELPKLSSGLFWHVVTQPDTLLLAVADYLSGDYNRDGFINAADYTVWRDALDSTVDLAADGNFDGTVNEADYSLWKTSFLAASARGSLAGGSQTFDGPATAPEPSAIVLVVVAACAALGAKPRDNSKSAIVRQSVRCGDAGN